MGNYQTLEQLLNENPAIVARNEFLSAMLKSLFDFTCYLNSRGIYHVCYAPSNILMRKNDNAVRLLCHGSFYKDVDADLLYEGVTDYIAPEALNRGKIDARSDVYSLGKLMTYLYNSASIPLELKPIIKKATDVNPDKRYASVEDFEAAIKRAQNLKHTGLLAAAALAIALIIVGLFFYTSAAMFCCKGMALIVRLIIMQLEQ